MQLNAPKGVFAGAALVALVAWAPQSTDIAVGPAAGGTQARGPNNSLPKDGVPTMSLGTSVPSLDATSLRAWNDGAVQGPGLVVGSPGETGNLGDVSELSEHWTLITFQNLGDTPVDLSGPGIASLTLSPPQSRTRRLTGSGPVNYAGQGSGSGVRFAWVTRVVQTGALP